VTAGASVVAFSHHGVVGASGAIFGLSGAAFAILLSNAPLRKSPEGRTAIRKMISSTLLQLLIGFTLPFISESAHLGGFVPGLLLGALLVWRPEGQGSSGELRTR
jgi:rhomboid protease GluP